MQAGKEDPAFKTESSRYSDYWKRYHTKTPSGIAFTPLTLDSIPGDKMGQASRASTCGDVLAPKSVTNKQQPDTSKDDDGKKHAKKDKKSKDKDKSSKKDKKDKKHSKKETGRGGGKEKKDKDKNKKDDKKGTSSGGKSNGGETGAGHAKKAKTKQTEVEVAKPGAWAMGCRWGDRVR